MWIGRGSLRVWVGRGSVRMGVVRRGGVSFCLLAGVWPGGRCLLGWLSSRRLCRLRGLGFVVLFLGWGRLRLFLLGQGTHGQGERTANPYGNKLFHITP